PPAPKTAQSTPQEASKKPAEVPAKQEAPPAAPAKSPADDAMALSAIKAAGGRLTTDAAGHVVAVDLQKGNGDDKTLEHIAKLPGLERLVLSGPAYTSAGLQQLGSVPSLRVLDLSSTGVDGA